VNTEPRRQLLTRWLLWTVGGTAVVVSFFFGTLFVLDNMEYKSTKTGDDLRAEHARLIMTALETYRSTHGTYPVFPPPHDVPAADLKNELVKAGLLARLPQDPVWPESPRYVSYNGKAYGLLFRIQIAKGKTPATGQCLMGIGTSGTGWWGEPPNCPF
jgi:hypothetical protein